MATTPTTVPLAKSWDEFSKSLEAYRQAVAMLEAAVDSALLVGAVDPKLVPKLHARLDAVKATSFGDSPV